LLLLFFFLQRFSLSWDWQEPRGRFVMCGGKCWRRDKSPEVPFTVNVGVPNIKTSTNQSPSSLVKGVIHLEAPRRHMRSSMYLKSTRSIGCRIKSKDICQLCHLLSSSYFLAIGKPYEPSVDDKHESHEHIPASLRVPMIRMASHLRHSCNMITE